MAGLRFCSLTTFYPPFNFGGDGIDVQRTARALAARGHHVTVIHDVDAYQWLSSHQLPEQPVEQDGVHVIGLRSKLGVISPLLTHQLGRPVVHGRRLREIVDKGAFDVVLFNNVSLVGGPELLRLGNGSLRIYVAHEHWLVCPTHVLWRFNREPCDERKCVQCVTSYRRPPQYWRYTGALERRLDDVDVFIARSEFSRVKHREFGFPTAGFAGLLLFSSANQFANLQWNTGVRYMVPLVPLLFLAALPVLASLPRALTLGIVGASGLISIAVSMYREDVTTSLRLLFTEGPTFPVLLVLEKMASGYDFGLPAGMFWIIVAGVGVVLWLAWRPWFTPNAERYTRTHRRTFAHPLRPPPLQ